LRVVLHPTQCAPGNLHMPRSAPLPQRAKLASERVALAATVMTPAMKRVVEFGNAGGRQIHHLEAAVGIDETAAPSARPDAVSARRGTVPHEEYLQAHAELMLRDEWIVDDFGCVASAWQRFAKAYTLVYVDLPLATHHWWATKRLLRGLFVNPEGWPANGPIWASTLDSYQVLWRCHRGPRYRQIVADASASKWVTI
jgi:hypothetical protein